MSVSPSPQLKWSAQLKVSSSPSGKKLKGDKIILPQSALEQLLSVTTVNVPVESSTQNLSGTFDPFNPYTFAAERQARSQLFERQQQLPHPLTFRLVNPKNANVVYAGVREFSAEEDEVVLSPFLREALGLVDDARFEETVPDEENETDQPQKHEQQHVTIHAEQLPKGTNVRFRPLEAGYDPEDWKSLLERHMRDTFTTLTKGEILTIRSGADQYKFLLDKVEPDGNAICIVDTDLEVDIEALNEEQARETLKRRLQKSERAKMVEQGNSKGGILTMGKTEIGQVLRGSYVDYTLHDWDRSRGIEFRIDEESGSVDLFVSPFDHDHRAKPRQNEHVFAEVSDRPSKRICIRKSHIELENAESVNISAHGWEDSSSSDGKGKSRDVPLQFSLTAFPFETDSDGSDGTIQNGTRDESTDAGPDEVQCKNCKQYIPKRTLFLHENFCLRNNISCPHCSQVFLKTSEAWKSHWHCPHDSAHGSGEPSRDKHDKINHEPQICSDCSYHCPNTLALAQHRTSTCPAKLILCQFCHLVVAQQDDFASNGNGNGALTFSDPEILLSGLTPHEYADGARTTECHLCGKITRLRDLNIHLKHHDLERLGRAPPRICRNVNCGRTLDGVGAKGEVRPPKRLNNDLGLCDTCFGPLYNSVFDPEGKALKRRVERRYLSQLLTGCGKSWCRNEFCKQGKQNLVQELGQKGTIGDGKITMKEANAMVKPILDGLLDVHTQGLHFCTDEGSQHRRFAASLLADMDTGETGYDLRWCVAAMEATGITDVEKAREWLAAWAPQRGEMR
ncbi:hypothetical protein MMC25_000317 [Agyrium rufum]|nr:hypothetical protein [Agyrium rufum]